MKTFVFIHKNTSAVLTFSAEDFTDAEEILDMMVIESSLWRVENEEGTDEE